MTMSDHDRAQELTLLRDIEGISESEAGRLGIAVGYHNGISHFLGPFGGIGRFDAT